MAKGRHDQWLTPEGLTRLEGFAREGLTDEQIAAKMGISPSCFYNWQNRFVEMLEALKRGKAPVDIQVENTLLKAALGYEYEEIVTEIIELPDGEQRKQVRKVKHYAQPSTTAQIFWLKNRRPDKWRDRHELSGDINVAASTGESLQKAIESLKKGAQND